MHAHRLATVTVLCLLLATAGWAQQTVTENFEGQLQNWELHDGAQIVQQQRVGKVLQFGQHGFAAWDVQVAQNFTLQMSVKVQQESMFGMIFRNTGEPPNHSEYQVVYEAGQMHILKIADGQESTLAAGSGPQPNTWANLSVQVNAGRITVAVNNQQVASASDRAPLSQGGGLAFHGANASIDTLTLAGGMGQTQMINLPTGGGGGGDSTSAMGGYSTGRQLAAGTSGVFLYVPGVQGASTRQHLRGWINCIDWEFSVGPRGTTRDDNHQLTVTRYLSRATPTLWQYAAQGRKIKEARLLVVEAGRVMMDLQMMDVAFLSAGRSDVEPAAQPTDRNIEHVKMDAQRFRWQTPTYDESGKPGGQVRGGWNYAQNKPID
jgi:type VI protein secretion system component Hcp